MENGVSIEMTPGSDNIFADIGLPEADDHKLKAQIVIHMKLLIEFRKSRAVPIKFRKFHWILVAHL